MSVTHNYNHGSFMDYNRHFSDTNIDLAFVLSAIDAKYHYLLNKRVDIRVRNIGRIANGMIE